MACTTCLVCLYSTVISHCKNTEKQALVASTKQSKLPRGQSGLFKISFCFVPATSAFVLLKWMFRKLTSVEQSTFSWISMNICFEN
jgi:hypothetical protein